MQVLDMNRKRVVVTGGAGFPASFVVERLQHKEWCKGGFHPPERGV